MPDHKKAVRNVPTIVACFGNNCRHACRMDSEGEMAELSDRAAYGWKLSPAPSLPALAFRALALPDV